jgi:hypothetical protein
MLHLTVRDAARVWSAQQNAQAYFREVFNRYGFAPPPNTQNRKLNELRNRLENVENELMNRYGISHTVLYHNMANYYTLQNAAAPRIERAARSHISRSRLRSAMRTLPRTNKIHKELVAVQRHPKVLLKRAMAQRTRSAPNGRRASPNVVLRRRGASAPAPRRRTPTPRAATVAEVIRALSMKGRSKIRPSNVGSL